MILINECRVSNDNKKIYVNAETTVGYSITSIKLWDQDTFKVFSKAKEIFPFNVNHQEVLVITAESLGIKKFDGIYFIEFETDAPNEECSTCPNPVTAVVTNLVSYYKCGMNMLLKASRSCLGLFASNVCDSGDANNAMSVHLLIDGINEAIKINRFVDAIMLLNNLKKICNSCSDCGTTSESNQVECNSCGTTSVYYN